MTASGIYFGSKASTFGNQYANIELDIVSEETHSWSADATSNPVEDGAAVSDHVIEQADKLTLKCVVSDDTIRASQSVGAVPRTQDVFDKLYLLIKKKEVMTVYTKFKLYDNMILTSVDIPRSGSQQAIEFDLSFINIRKVKTQTVDVPKGVNADPKKTAGKGTKTPSVQEKAQAKKDQGKKQAEEKPPKPSSGTYRLGTKVGDKIYDFLHSF